MRSRLHRSLITTKPGDGKWPYLPNVYQWIVVGKLRSIVVFNPDRVTFRFLSFLIACFLCVASIASAQRRTPTSVIVKLKSSSANADANFRNKLFAITGSQLSPSQAFQKHTRQNTLSIGGFGFDRIYVIPLAGPRDASIAASEISRLAEIEYAQPNLIYTLDAAQVNDPSYDKQWYLRNVRADKAWEIASGDSTVAIGVLDTGVDWEHEDLATQFKINKPEDINGNGLFDAWPSTSRAKDVFGNEVNGDLDGLDQDRNGFADDVIGYDFVDQESLNFGDASERDALPGDEHGHGTQVSGVIAAKRDNGKGISGIAPGCRLVGLRAFDATGNGEDDDIATAIIYAVENGVKVINLSFGDFVPSMLQRDAIRYAVTQGVTVVASSGNEGGFDRHYPSDFDEVISVGATTNYPYEDVLASLTTSGESMDIVAPGTDIYTTDLDGGYKSVGGTSFSAPIVAAVAGLLLSKEKQLTPDQVRGILISTTKDLGLRGFDPETANGRVDALNALQYRGAATVKITSPKTNEGVKAGTNVGVIAYSTLFTNWQLSFAPALDPKRAPVADKDRGWVTLAENTSQVVQPFFGTWNLQDLTPGLYTLRLSLYSSDQRITEERINVHVVGEAPKITRFVVDSIWLHDKRGLLVDVDADQVSRMVVRLRQVGSSNWSQKSDDRMTRGHSLVLSTNEVLAGQQYEVETIITNTVGDTVSQTVIATVPDEGVSQRGFVTKPYALPPGYALDTVVSQPSGDHVAMSVFPNGINFGPLKIFRFNGSGFVQADSLTEAWIPRGVGNTRGTGSELLLQSERFSQLYEIGTDKFLRAKIWESDKSTEFWGSALTDIDGDGDKEVVGKSSRFVDRRLEDNYEVFDFRGGSYQSIGILPNTTAPEPGRSSNRFTEPNAAHADLDGDGGEELLIIDNDADVIVYTFKNGQFNTIFTEENDGSGEGSTVAIGDVNGDGLNDIIYGFHSTFDLNRDREYDPLYWTVKVLLNQNGSFKEVYKDRFFYARPLNPYRSSITTIPNVTGRGAENIVVSLFPNLYLLEWNAVENRIEPVWHYPASLSARGAVAFDFDRNGIREFGFVAGDSIRFFERQDNYTERPLAPGALTATPVGEQYVRLDWGRVSGADRYLILKAEEGATEFDLIDSTSNTSYEDADILLGTRYFYSVIAIEDAKPVRESPLAFTVTALIHPQPRISRATVFKGQLRIHSSEPLGDRGISGAQFVIDDSITVSTAIRSGDSAIVLTPSRALSPGQHFIRVTSWELRDKFNSPFDTAQRFVFVQPSASDDTARFYVTRWRFEGSRRIHVEFNSQPSDEALDVQFYSLSPFGKLQRVYRDTANAFALYIDLDPTTKIIALGKPFVLCIREIKDIYGVPIDPLEGGCIGVTLTEPDLTNIMVYPSPAKRSDGELMFARLTAEAEISIYTMDMRFIKRLRTTERNGGVRWDMRDENGEPLPSGIYLYSVTGKNDDGQEVEDNQQKFVIIADR
jgi:subtilisin family serine protease